MLFLPTEGSQTLEMAQSGLSRLLGESKQNTILVVQAGRGGKHESDEDNLLIMCSTSALQDLISQHRKERCFVMTGVGIFAIVTDDAMF